MCYSSVCFRFDRQRESRLITFDCRKKVQSVQTICSDARTRPRVSGDRVPRRVESLSRGYILYALERVCVVPRVLFIVFFLLIIGFVHTDYLQMYRLRRV